MTVIGQGRELRAVPDLQIDGKFVLITGVAVDGDRNIAALDARDARVYLFSSSGRELARVGRRGGGPGEFTQPANMGTWNGGVWVSDPMAPRVTLLSKALAVESMFRGMTAISHSPAGIATGRGMPTIIGLGSGEEVLVRATPPAVDPKSLSMFAVGKTGGIFMIVGRDGRFLRMLGRIAASPQCVVEGPNHAAATIPLCSEQIAGVSQDGTRLGFLVPGKEPGSPSELTVVTRTGDTLFKTSVPRVLERIPRSMADSLFTTAIRYQPDVRLPEYFPAATRLVIGRDGSIWIEEPHAASQRKWVVFDPQGRLRGHVLLPPRLRLLEAELTQIWGVERDEDDVQSVARMRIEG